jgi:hypothetical protein
MKRVIFRGEMTQLGLNHPSHNGGLKGDDS